MGGGFEALAVLAVFGGIWFLSTITRVLGLQDNFRSWFGIIFFGILSVNLILLLFYLLDN
jgi:hypothetical protein